MSIRTFNADYKRGIRKADKARQAEIQAETPQGNPVLCMLESAAIRASVNPVLAGQAVMLRNLAAVLRDNPVMTGHVERLMAAKLREVAGMPEVS